MMLYVHSSLRQYEQWIWKACKRKTTGIDLHRVCGNSVSKSIKRKGLLTGQGGESGAAFEKVLMMRKICLDQDLC